MDSERILVLGAGQMGGGIAQVAALAGYRVTMCDVSQGLLDRGLAAIRRSLDRMVARGPLTAAEAEAAVARITPVTDPAAGQDAHLAIEAIVEDVTAKVDLWRRLDGILSPQAFRASNTSSISITRLAAATSRPERFIGMHFFNPVPVMRLCELIRGMATSEETYAAVRAAAERMGKTTVEARDYPGFVANRILMPLINEAVYALMEGVASAADIDQVAKLGLNHPMGPLALADLIGLDTCLSVLEVLHRDLGDPKFRPCPLLRKYVEAGWLGRKSGKGFFEYGT
jgi:3-hydroxybutyryl-CoA dehydrogenase